MKRFRRQFFLGTFALIVATSVALWLHAKFSHALPDYAFLTGWVLFAAMLVLTFFNARKKLPFLSLGKAETWLQIHIYLGFFTVVLFLIHLDFRAPHGWFEITLAWLFTLVSVSGVVGLFFSRTLPRRLATRGGEVIFEKIPALRHALKTGAENLALGADAKSPVIAEFYARRLALFFAGPKNLWLHVVESRRPLNALIAELDDLRRFANETERVTLEKLTALVRQKDGLDYHRALQLALKLWLFVHIPLTYGLLIFTALHIVLVFGFSGGAR
jgi:peptidoglycan biosynthesis protein MviN/MurJ (putative lipid II flippase)